jgi:hypothetical protein
MNSKSLGTALVLSAAAFGAQANLLVNGNFEDATPSTGWSSTPTTGFAPISVYGTCCANTGGAYTGGSNAAFFGWDQRTGGSIWQDFATTVGASYTVSFQYGAIAAANLQSLVAEALGGPSFSSVLGTTTVQAPGTTNWNQILGAPVSFTFVATGTSTRLLFRDTSLGSNNTDGVLDNVAVVPEPATVALMLAGLGVVGFMARRRKGAGGQPALGAAARALESPSRADRHTESIGRVHAMKFSVIGPRIVLAAASVLASAGAVAQTYDPTTGFSGTNGGSSVWSYGYSTSLGGAFNAFTTFADIVAAPSQGGTLQAWSGPSPNDVPWIGKSGASGFTCCNSVTIDPNTLTLHPRDGQYAVLQFTAPTSSQYSFSGSFFNQDTGQSNSQGATTDVHVRTATALLFNGFLTGGANQPAVTFGGSVSLMAGQVLSFWVGPDTGPGTFFFDSTGLTASVTAVPEPATVALMLAGLGVVGFLARHRGVTGRQPMPA